MDLPFQFCVCRRNELLISKTGTERARVNVNISFELYDDDNLRTLSTNTVSNGADIEGLLYVPDLSPSDPCVNASQSYIPNNATRKANLLDQQYSYIAFAPWISVPCTKSYLAASSGARAFMTFLPDNGVVKPPLADAEAWDLYDGGQWKAQNKFPVYAIPGAEGAAIMQQMGQYSGNSSTTRIADMLAQEQLDPSDYVRLYASFGTSESSNLPTLWAFLLIILGLVLLIVGTTSLLMHWVQRRRRQDLQRRVDNGEVNLETLGIKRTCITQEAIDPLPMSPYTQQEETGGEPNTTVRDSSDVSAVEAAPGSSSPDHSQWSQPTCPICLDDFVLDITMIRHLPCHHIYHPECIDPFLRENSSLCPVCKAAVLSSASKFYVTEPVTNVMVRHERQVRRMRQEMEAGGSSNRQASDPQAGNRRWIAGFSRGMGRRAVSAPRANPVAPTTSQNEMDSIERRAVSGPPIVLTGTGRLSTPPTDPNLRRDWIRTRLSTLRVHNRAFYDEGLEGPPRQSRCECSNASSSLKLTDAICVIRAQSYYCCFSRISVA